MRLQQYLQEWISSCNRKYPEGLTYLLNEGRTKGISIPEANKLIESKCKKTLKGYLAGGNVITRGLYDVNYKAGIIDPTKGEPRTSANTYNYYTLLMDNLPSWSKYPKRSKSIICSIGGMGQMVHSYNYAGEIYMVFPYDGCKIGIAPKDDIWSSFKGVMNMNLGRFAETMDNFIDNTPSKNVDKDWNKFKKALIDNKKLFMNHYARNIFGGEEDILEDDILEGFDNLMDPDYNKFKVVKPGKLPRVNDKECWVGNGPSIMINFGEDIGKDFKEWWESI